ncbi:MAG: hypothetical protein ACI3W8_00350 [Oscillospiraceae bacterium]
MKLEIKNQHIAILEKEPLVSGTVNVYTAEFSFDSAWHGYAPVAVFESSSTQGKVSREVVIADGKCTVPWEVLLPGSRLRIGVYGVSGDKRLPTIYADSQFVARGAEPAAEAAEPTPGVVEQIVSQVAEDRAAAETAAQRAEDASVRQPYPNAETGTWWVWDGDSEAYKDSGIASAGTVEAMTATTLGGAMADPAQEDDTQPVRIGADHKLYTAPGKGGSQENWTEVINAEVTEEEGIFGFEATDIGVFSEFYVSLILPAQDIVPVKVKVGSTYIVQNNDSMNTTKTTLWECHGIYDGKIWHVSYATGITSAGITSYALARYVPGQEVGDASTAIAITVNVRTQAFAKGTICRVVVR